MSLYKCIVYWKVGDTFKTELNNDQIANYEALAAVKSVKKGKKIK